MNWYIKATKGYVPLKHLDKNQLIDGVVQNIDSTGLSDYYQEIAKRDLGEDAAPELIEKRIDEIVREDLDDKYEERLWRMQDWARRFPVWRAIRIRTGASKLDDDIISNINLNPVGAYWSYDQNSAACHWGNYGPNTIQVTLKARITPSVVDWPSTMRLQIDPNLGEEEKEVRLMEGSRIVITEVFICEGHYSRSGRSVRVRLEAIA